VTVANAAFVAVLMLMLVPLTTLWGVMGAAYAVLATSVLCTPLYLHQVKRMLNIGPMVFVRALVRPLLATGVMIAALGSVLPPGDGGGGLVASTMWLLVGAGLGLLVYALGLYGLWYLAGRRPGPERIVLERLQRFVGARIQPGT
jgi:hypothetical protein